MGRLLPLLESSSPRIVRRGYPTARVLFGEQVESERGVGRVEDGDEWWQADEKIVVVVQGGGGRGSDEGGQHPLHGQRQSPRRRMRHRRTHAKHLQIHRRRHNGTHPQPIPGRSRQRALPRRRPLRQSQRRRKTPPGGTLSFRAGRLHETAVRRRLLRRRVRHRGDVPRPRSGRVLFRDPPRPQTRGDLRVLRMVSHRRVRPFRSGTRRDQKADRGGGRIAGHCVHASLFGGVEEGGVRDFGGEGLREG
mmetsp:Transcript_43049/g.90448  ORF Transcript_43049/g.90448 Transcript_43049/m.90448 type:complete len:249 (+) Transcript_43049:686-1432(+)